MDAGKRCGSAGAGRALCPYSILFVTLISPIEENIHFLYAKRQFLSKNTNFTQISLKNQRNSPNSLLIS